jgi:hypothetical protein
LRRAGHARPRTAGRFRARDETATDATSDPSGSRTPSAIRLRHDVVHRRRISMPVILHHFAVDLVGAAC